MKNLLKESSIRMKWFKCSSQLSREMIEKKTLSFCNFDNRLNLSRALKLKRNLKQSYQAQPQVAFQLLLASNLPFKNWQGLQEQSLPLLLQVLLLQFQLLHFESNKFETWKEIQSLSMITPKTLTCKSLRVKLIQVLKNPSLKIKSIFLI